MFLQKGRKIRDSFFEDSPKGRVPIKKTTKFKTYAKSLDPYLPCTLIWTEKSLDIFFILLPTYLLRKFGQIWKKVGTFIRPLDFLKIRGGPNVKYVKYLLTHL